MDLFDYMRQNNQEKEAPLAARLRPRTLDEVEDSSILSEKISCCTAPFRQTSFPLLFFTDCPERARPRWQR